MKMRRYNLGSVFMGSAIASAMLGLTGCVAPSGSLLRPHHDASTMGKASSDTNSIEGGTEVATHFTPGSLVISRPAPSVVLASSQELQLPERALGFVSLPERVTLAPARGSLVISRSTGKAHLLTGSQDRWLEGVSVLEMTPPPPTSEVLVQHQDINSSNSILASCQISLKQEDPAWYAPDSYYQRRQMEVPAANDGSRYLRGVYGDQALFCDAATAIHSSPGGLDEVGGIKIADEDLALVYQSLQIGDIIKIVE